MLTEADTSQPRPRKHGALPAEVQAGTQTIIPVNVKVDDGAWVIAEALVQALMVVEVELGAQSRLPWRKCGIIVEDNSSLF